MKNKSVLFYLVILSLIFQIKITYSQVTTGKIFYLKESYIPKNNNKSSVLVNEIAKKNSDVTKKLEYILKFKNSESIFNLNESLNLDFNDTSIKMANSISGGSGYYYTNIKTKKHIHQDVVGGQQFLIIERLDSVKWNLVNETKLIGDYLCYKATAIKIVKSKRIFYKEVIAWYCPKIPNAFGPIGYGNLPGLILELKIEKGATFTVKEMTINPREKIVIKKPTKGIKVTEEEFQESCKQMYLNRKRGM